MGIAELFDKKVGIARLFVLKMGIARLLVGIAELFDKKVGIVGCHPRRRRLVSARSCKSGL
jgi:hypothetical protein